MVPKIRPLLLFVTGTILFFVPMTTYGNDINLDDWHKELSSIRSQFPEVTHISTQELSAWLQDGERKSPILIDVREKREYEVSHLPNAILIEPRRDPKNTELINFDKNAEIVTYCSVGYRSAKLAKQLKRLGFQNVQNLEGSIFAWANEGRPLEIEGKQTSQVHPYNRYWKKYLKKHDMKTARHPQ